MTFSTNERPGLNQPEATFHALLRTFGLLRQNMEPYFARFGISGSQWAVLRVLERAEMNGIKGVRLSEIGERLFIQPPSVTGVVDRLEREGLVKRHGSPSDHRVRLVTLTTAGRQLVAKVLDGHSAKIRSLFTGVTMEELVSLFRLLKKLESRWADNALHRAPEPTSLKKPAELQPV